MSELSAFRKQMREAFAQYRWAEGCSCCRDTDGHRESEKRIGKLLRVRKYPDGSGYDFDRYRKEAQRG